MNFLKNFFICFFEKPNSFLNYTNISNKTKTNYYPLYFRFIKFFFLFILWGQFVYAVLRYMLFMWWTAKGTVSPTFTLETIPPNFCPLLLEPWPIWEKEKKNKPWKREAPRPTWLGFSLIPSLHTVLRYGQKNILN